MILNRFPFKHCKLSSIKMRAFGFGETITVLLAVSLQLKVTLFNASITVNTPSVL